MRNNLTLRGNCMKVAIMTDTNSGLSFQEAEELGLYMLPMPVLIDSECRFENVNLKEEEFFACLEAGRDVTTSQPSPGDVMELWEKIFAEGYEQLVYIPMSSALSSSCASARGLAQEYEGRVFVADNHRISVTLIEAAKSALKMAAEGMDGQEIVKRLEAEAYEASIYITVNTLKFLKKSGRVTPAGAALGSVLQIKPVLTIQGGKLDAFAKARGMKKAKRIMSESLKKDISERFQASPEEFIIYLAGSGLTKEEIEAFKEDMAMEFPGCRLCYYPLSLSVCAHTGRGALGIAVCKR